jgi:hypothetical protein
VWRRIEGAGERAFITVHRLLFGAGVAI